MKTLKQRTHEGIQNLQTFPERDIKAKEHLLYRVRSGYTDGIAEQ